MTYVLITGVAGFIGMHTAIRFLESGYNIIGLDNLNDYYSVSLKKDRLANIDLKAKERDNSFIYFHEDLNSNIWNELLLLKIEAVIHLAAQAGVRYSIENPQAYVSSNILGFQRVLDFVKTKEIKKFLYASSSSVYGKNTPQPFNETASCDSPESYYAATKRANELMAHSYWKTHKIKSVGLRFFTVYGSWGRPDMAPMLFAKAAFSGDTIKVFNNGNQRRDFTHIIDIVESIFQLFICYDLQILKAEIINVGNGSPVGLMEFISVIEKSTNRDLKKTYVDAQNGDVEETYADDSKLISIIGKRKKIELQNGINEFISWYIKYYENTDN
jgi:UDP-glucuronate 4-epimerase